MVKMRKLGPGERLTDEEWEAWNASLAAARERGDLLDLTTLTARLKALEAEVAGLTARVEGLIGGGDHDSQV